MGKNRDGSISIRTIGDRIDNGQDMTVYCSECGRHNNLDLEGLADKLGRDHSALAGDLAKKLRCKGCGSKRMSFSVGSRAGWDGAGGHSHS